MHLKLLEKKWLKKNKKKTEKATDDLICNKFADRITKVSKTSPNNNSETNDEEILTERFIPPEIGNKNYWWSNIKERKIYMDDIRKRIIWWYKINIII